jgi:hypothetical protein
MIRYASVGERKSFKKTGRSTSSRLVGVLEAFLHVCWRRGHREPACVLKGMAWLHLYPTLMPKKTLLVCYSVIVYYELLIALDPSYHHPVGYYE